MERKEIYLDAVSIKKRNKRIVLRLDKEGNYIITTIILDGDLSPRNIHKVLKNKAVLTAFKFSKEGMDALVESYNILKAKQNDKIQSRGQICTPKTQR